MKVEVGPKPDLRVRGKEIPAGVGPVWGSRLIYLRPQELA